MRGGERKEKVRGAKWGKEREGTKYDVRGTKWGKEGEGTGYYV